MYNRWELESSTNCYSRVISIVYITWAASQQIRGHLYSTRNIPLYELAHGWTVSSAPTSLTLCHYIFVSNITNWKDSTPHCVLKKRKCFFWALNGWKSSSKIQFYFLLGFIIDYGSATVQTQIELRGGHTSSTFNHWRPSDNHFTCERNTMYSLMSMSINHYWSSSCLSGTDGPDHYQFYIKRKSVTVWSVGSSCIISSGYIKKLSTLWWSEKQGTVINHRHHRRIKLNLLIH